RNRRAEAQSFDRVDGGQPRQESEQPEAGPERSPARCGRGFRHASGVGAREIRETEQQQRRRDRDGTVKALALRQEDAEHEEGRRQDEHVTQWIGDLREGYRGPAHQSVGRDGQKRKPARAGGGGDDQDEKNAILDGAPQHRRGVSTQRHLMKPLAFRYVTATCFASWPSMAILALSICSVDVSSERKMGVKAALIPG